MKNKKEDSASTLKLSVKINADTAVIEFENKISLLIETLDLIKSSKRVQVKKIRNLDSFLQFENNNLKLLCPNKSDSFLQRLMHYWDIIILSLIILAFSIYLGYFLNVYFSTDIKSQNQFYTKAGLAYKWIIAKWLLFNGFTDLTKEECALESPDFMNSVTRPIDDCSMCNYDLTHVQRISNVSQEEFLENYAYTGVPVIVTDAIANWSALNVFTFKFLKDLYLNINRNKKSKTNRKPTGLKELALFKKLRNQMTTGKNADRITNSDEKLTCQFFPYKTKFRDLRQLFETVENHLNEEGRWEKPWYVGWSNCHDHVSKILRTHYQRPYFLPEDSEMSKLDWIFMGTPGYGANLHVINENFQIMLKLFYILFLIYFNCRSMMSAIRRGKHRLVV